MYACMHELRRVGFNMYVGVNAYLSVYACINVRTDVCMYEHMHAFFYALSHVQLHILLNNV